MGDTDFNGNDLQPVIRRKAANYVECCELCVQNADAGCKVGRSNARLLFWFLNSGIEI